MPNRETERYYDLMQQRRAVNKHLVELLKDDRRLTTDMDTLMEQNEIDWEWIRQQMEAE
jgi:hypothetical protein